ncbi:MAG TPA: hypothetical protein VGF99_21870, partial [Myxococcota bacterium]
MSSIWHDPDFEPIRQFQAPIVTKNFDDLPVPTEVHELPEGVADPFAKLDAAWDVAGAQMERGIKGAEFLHGKPPPRVGEANGALAGPDDVTRLQQRPDRFEAAPPKPVAQQVQRKELDEQHRRLDHAAVVAVPHGTSTASNNTAAAREAARLANAGGVDGAALSFAPMVAGQLAAAAVPTPLAPAASQAAQLVNTLSAAGE